MLDPGGLAGEPRAEGSGGDEGSILERWLDCDEDFGVGGSV